MSAIRYAMLFLILVASSSGCKTFKVIQPDRLVTETPAMPSGELRGYLILPESWVNNNPDAMYRNIISLIEKVSEANYNAVFFKVREKGEVYYPSDIESWSEKLKNRMPQFDPLKVAIETARKQKLKIYAGVDLLLPADGTRDLSLPRMKSFLKKSKNDLISNYDIDGLGLEVTDQAPDLIEDIVVEAMLVKPYLINSIVYSGEKGYQTGVSCLEEGIADLIMPKDDIVIKSTDTLPFSYPDKVKIPDRLKRISPEQVAGLDLSEMFPEDPGGRIIRVCQSGKSKITDSEGHIGLITNHPDTIKLESTGRSMILPTGRWVLPYKFGAETSSTWITHRTGRKIIEKVTWNQTTPETYRIYVNLKTAAIWGYDIRPEGKSLVFRIKYPPEYDLKNNKPLTGLKIAIEAGHGGLSTGAVGLSGLLEKDINLDLSLKLGELCRNKGAEVLQIRETDKDMSLIEKRDIAISSGADLLVSIHANAGGSGSGYLQVPGTSTYYNNPFRAPLAETVYDRLLELGLDEFGVIGSFNYTVIRVSKMPSILVERAFLSHAEDEEKLADPQFRQDMAQKICEGIIDYLIYMRQ